MSKRAQQNDHVILNIGTDKYSKKNNENFEIKQKKTKIKWLYIIILFFIFIILVISIISIVLINVKLSQINDKIESTLILLNKISKAGIEILNFKDEQNYLK